MELGIAKEKTNKQSMKRTQTIKQSMLYMSSSLLPRSWSCRFYGWYRPL